MTLPLLDYSPTSSNQRVAGFEVPGDEQPKVYDLEQLHSQDEIKELIEAAYRQIFSEHQLLKSNRQPVLESQLKNRKISVKDFIRGLATSETFRERNYETNNNYRFVQMCVQRLLGRDVYSEREKIAWSIVLATKGLPGFIDDLLDSEEYARYFGNSIVPYQRRRILPQRSQGDVLFVRQTPRYGDMFRTQLEAMGYFRKQKDYIWEWQKPPFSQAYRILAIAVGGATAAFIVAFLILTMLEFIGIVNI
ncbi:phycobilisome rod-core linker polypeptide [Geitlerinema sp. PCC 9228]|jgi:phycobilisome rod-core linker protein|uniref:phycobilisome rod-core linker polypeptide n=1 Tax=Geitlerinema sp. PCC 9228 TaxID=111611 RepID=UPI0008F9914C|nr:phycobilisome rod-core linker polypeptide [Geitlerinema sp. PCC 9228]